MSGALVLEPEPRSVREARSWVVGELRAISRDDLADSAELGVSELVTNAILHAGSPIVVRLGGTAAHPRVEVHDDFPAAPAMRDMTEDSRLMATVGRGLGIVAMYSSTWGAELSPDGKVVWFEPAADPDVEAGVAPGRPAEVFDLSQVLDDLAGVADGADDGVEARVTVCLLGLPVQVFVHYWSWFVELRRELRLLALHHGDDYPVARELTDLALVVEQERRQARSGDPLAAALASDHDRVDVECDVPATTPATMARLAELFDQVDEFCREQRLLTASPDAQQVAVRSWYLGEFERQARGEPPTPWPGGYDVDDPEQ